MAKKKLELSDILEVMHQRFNMVTAQFDKNDKQFAFLSSKLHSIHDDIKEFNDAQKTIWES